MSTIFRAIVGYFVLLITIRLLARRPGSQMTPFEFVLIFLIGGVIILSTMQKDRSLTNATLAVIAVGLLHHSVAYARNRWGRFRRLLDGSPLVLYDDGSWREDTMTKMKISPEDVLAAARAKGLRGMDDIQFAILELNGQISVLSRRES